MMRGSSAGRESRRSRAACAALALTAVGCTSAPDSSRPQPRPQPTVVVGKLPPAARLLTPEGHLAPIVCLSFSPDGRQLLSGSDDSTMLVWDLETGRVVKRLEGHHGFVSQCAFFPDGRRVASSGWGGEVLIWDMATGNPSRIGELTDDVTALAVSASGHELMVGTVSGEVKAWNVDTGVERFSNSDLKNGPSGSKVWTVGYLDEERRFGGGYKGSVFVWSPKGRRVIDYNPSSGVVLPGGRLLLGGLRGLITADPDGSKHSFGQYDDWVYGLAANPRRDLVLAGDGVGNTSVWNLSNGSRRCQLSKSAAIKAAAFDPTGEQFAVAGADAVVMLAGTASCKDPATKVALRPLRTDRSRIQCVAAGSSILLGDGVGNISSWSRSSLRGQASVHAHAGQVNTLAFLADGRWVSGGYNGTIALSLPSRSRVFGSFMHATSKVEPAGDQKSVLTIDGDTLTQAPLNGGPFTKLLSGKDELYALAVRPGTSEVVTGGKSPDLYKIVLSRRGAPVPWPRAGDSVMALAYDPDGRWLGEGSLDGVVALRRADTGDIDRRLTGLHDEVNALLFTREHLWAGGNNHRLLRWSLAASALAAGNEPDIPPIDEGSRIFGLALTLDERYLIVALGDGSASVRTLPQGELKAHLIPLRDGSWATVFADGHYEASAGGNAVSLVRRELGGAIDAEKQDEHPVPTHAQSLPLVWMAALALVALASAGGLVLQWRAVSRRRRTISGREGSRHEQKASNAVSRQGVFKMLQSTFISYGGPDTDFAQKLNDALRENGVTTFFFAKDAIPGVMLQRLMKEGVNQHDRVILVCSQASLERPGVLNGIAETLRREARDGGAEYLIPITLDDYVYPGSAWQPKNPGVAQAIRDRVVADFRGAAADPVKFDNGLLRLIAALKK